MTNKKIAGVLNEIATLLDLAGESPFKGRAYVNVGRRIEQLGENVETLVQEKRLREIKGVGDALEQKIEELVTTGKLAYLNKLRRKFPSTLFELFDIPGLGAKRVKVLYDDLGISSLDDLSNACKTGEVSTLKGFGPKMVAKIADGIAFAKAHTGQYHFDKALAEARRILSLLEHEPFVDRIEIAGSLRRCKEVIKDVDIVVASAKPSKVMARFVENEAVSRVTGHGDTKSSVVMESGIAVDLRVVSVHAFPYALAHLTGSKEHNVALRQLAKERGFKLNEYGLFNREKPMSCEDESAIYKALDLPYIPPELREDRGEFDITKTPDLLTKNDLKGVIHCHTTYSDGINALEEMAEAAQERGYEYIGISDHSQSAAYAGGLKPERVRIQQNEIDALNKQWKDFRILKGIESDIKTDGSLDYEEDVLKTFEFVIASVHSQLDMTENDATARVVKAIENPYTTILGHSTGRLLLAREGYPLDYNKVFDACAANRVAVEINGNCRRLELDWRYVRQAKEKGVRLVIGPDAHAIEGLRNVVYGVGIARKGWLEASDVLNSLSAKDFLEWAK